MRAITKAMYAWGEWKVKELMHNPYSETNILYRYAREGEIQSMPSRDRILCYDPKYNKRHLIDINQLWMRLSRRQKQCVFGKYVLTLLVKEDGNAVTAREAAQMVGVNFDAFNRNVSRGVRSINGKVSL